MGKWVPMIDDNTHQPRRFDRSVEWACRPTRESSVFSGQLNINPLFWLIIQQTVVKTDGKPHLQSNRQVNVSQLRYNVPIPANRRATNHLMKWLLTVSSKSGKEYDQQIPTSYSGMSKIFFLMVYESEWLYMVLGQLSNLVQPQITEIKAMNSWLIDFRHVVSMNNSERQSMKWFGSIRFG